MKAARHTECHLCGGLISPGDDITQRGGQWVHVHAGRTLGHVAGLKIIRELRESLAEMS